MILLFKFLLCLFYFSASCAFDVRVLLEKFVIGDATPVECKLSSQHGMMISGIQDPLVGSVSITFTDKEFMINGMSIAEDMLTINPALPINYGNKIHQFVVAWEKEHHDFCYEQLMSLTDFYEKFVNDRKLRDYTQLYQTMQSCIDLCIQDFITSIEHPVISYESLVIRAQQQLATRLKVLLTTAIQGKKLSKSLMHQIEKLPKVRTDFFVKILEQILVEFLTDFFVSLPHKIIQQAMKEDTGCLLFGKNKYLGTFYLIRDKQAILLINSLDIDDYLFSVLHSEGWPGWPMEVYKALVVASRTYLVKRVLQANKSKRWYHIVNSIQHQTYKGHHKYLRLKQAVDETRDMVITYQGQPIEAMFDACCGSVVPAKIEGFDYKNHSYLARSKACFYCKKFKIYAWKKELSRLEITETLRQDHSKLDDVIDIKITQRDSAGLVKQVLVVTKKQRFYVSGKKMYSLFPAVKSFCYTIKKKGKSFVFQGKGFGHHMGLCQWGSLGMIQDNWNYTKVLQFYYPGTEFMKLSLLR